MQAVSICGNGGRLHNVLNDAPKPQIDWYVFASLITMSAAPTAPGDLNWIGLGYRFLYVSSWDLSQVVDHCARDETADQLRFRVRQPRDEGTHDVVDLLGENGNGVGHDRREDCEAHLPT